MQVHQFNIKNKANKRIGRGGKRGTFSGRGIKGQKARGGHQPRVDFAGGDNPFYKTQAKLRGASRKKRFTFSPKHRALQPEIITFNLGFLAKHFKAGEVVSLKSLQEKGLLGVKNKKQTKLKILAQGKLDKKLEFKDCEFSQAARVKARMTNDK